MSILRNTVKSSNLAWVTITVLLVYIHHMCLCHCWWHWRRWVWPARLDPAQPRTHPRGSCLDLHPQQCYSQLQLHSEIWAHDWSHTSRIQRIVGMCSDVTYLLPSRRCCCWALRWTCRSHYHRGCRASAWGQLASALVDKPTALLLVSCKTRVCVSKFGTNFTG